MRKKLTVLVLVGLALVLLAGPALAAGSGRTTYVKKTDPYNGRKPHVISLTGKVLKSADNSIYVYIQMTNRPFISYRGDTEWITALSTITYITWEGKTRTIGLPDSGLTYLVGKKVSINGRVADGKITARRVEVSKPRYP